ncbi:hypothetical protein PMAYCL1PPCAC_03884, partial [Pristionchus mayeri]
RFLTMNRLLVVLALVVVSVVAVEQWTAWTEVKDAPCSDTCGYCGRQLVAERTCPVLGKCSGASRRYEECGSKMCGFPRNTCCSGYVKGLPDGINFECIALGATAA